MFCTNCGAKISKDTMFCPHCGSKVTQNQVSSGGNSSKLHKLFSGRLTRGNYFVGHLFILLLIAVFFGILFTIYEDNFSTFGGLLLLIGYIIYFLYEISISIRRLHDLGKSGWFLFWSLVPLINIGIALWMLFTDSKTETNQYGPFPDKKISLKQILALQ